MRNITQSIKVVALAVILSLGLSYVYAWTAPSTNPPTGNVSAPINTGTTAQVKDGSFGVNGLLRGYGDVIVDGNVGIGTASPSAKLDVAGTVKSSETCLGASCISTWAQANDTETGLSAVLAPLKNKTISCTGTPSSGGGIVYYASVSSTGALSVRMTMTDADGNITDSGWVPGKVTSIGMYRAQADATGLFGFVEKPIRVSATIYALTRVEALACSAIWPTS